MRLWKACQLNVDSLFFLLEGIEGIEGIEGRKGLEGIEGLEGLEGRKGLEGGKGMFFLGEYIKRKKETDFSISFSELGGSRTHNRLIRSQGLYPIELPVQLISSAKIQLFLYLSTVK